MEALLYISHPFVSRRNRLNLDHLSDYHRILITTTVRRGELTAALIGIYHSFLSTAVTLITGMISGRSFIVICIQ